MFLGDIDLSSFGPYYGDRSSNLDDFERSMARCREIDAKWDVTFHQKGVVEGRSNFLVELDTYADIVRQREPSLLRFLSEPRSLAEIVAHRFVYRAHVDLPFVTAVERRTAELHLARMVTIGLVTTADTALYRAT